MTLRLLTITLLLSLSSLAAKEDEGAFSEVVVGDETQDVFAKLIEKSDLAKDIYEKCKEEKGAKGLQSCLKIKWQELDESKQAQLAEELKKVTVTFEDGQQIRKSETIKNINVNPLSTSLSTHTDPAMLKLREHLSKKLSESLYGEAQKNKSGPSKYVDHETFYRLFESQVGQNIIMAVSDYCMNSNMTSGRVDQKESEDKKAGLFFIFGKDSADSNREKNLKDVKENFSASGTKRDEAQDRFNLCVKSIPDICHNGKNAIAKSGPTPFEREDGRIVSGHYQNGSELDYAKNQACLVTEYLTKAREVLSSSESIRKQLNESLVKPGTLSFQEVESNKVYRDGQGDSELTVQELAIQTSNDIKKSGMDEEAQRLAEEIDSCQGNIEEGVCADLLSDDIEEKKEILAEEFFRAQAQKQRLVAELEDPEKVKEFLESEGYNPEDIIAGVGSEEEVKKQIIDRYEAQKNAVIEELAAEIDSKSVGATAEETAANITNIKNSITARTKELSDLLHFANLSSSFIEVTKGSGKDATRSVNTIAAFTELNSVSIEESNRTPSQQGGTLTSLYDDSSTLDKNKEFVQELENKNSDSGNGMDGIGNTSMSVDTLNEVLDYDMKEQPSN